MSYQGRDRDSYSTTKTPMLIRQVQGDIHRATGHAYRSLEIACEGMEATALRDLVRLIRNLQAQSRSEKQKRQRGQFWG